MYRIDPHVHCRDGKQSHKETIAHALSVAEKAGLSAIFDMPNTDPPIIWPEDAENRLKLVPKESKVFYGLYLGLTSNKDQIKAAIEAYNKNKHVIGFKLYAGHSVGNLALTDEKDQETVWQNLQNYNGLITVHCEKESYFENIWNPEDPITHSLARPAIAELESAKDQINLALKHDFKGTLNIAHISCPETVDLVNQFKNKLKITCATTPHHILLSNEIMKSENGLLYKMNPPLRDEQRMLKMREYLKQGKIDFIETDHAPHSLKEKINAPYMSGIPGLHAYNRFINWLRSNGFSEQLIDNITCHNIVKAFNLNGKGIKLNINMPANEDLSNEYEFEPYKGIL